MCHCEHSSITFWWGFTTLSWKEITIISLKCNLIRCYKWIKIKRKIQKFRPANELNFLKEAFFTSILSWHVCHQFLQYLILKQQWVLDSKTYSECGNIHSIILDVRAVKQSALKLSFQSSQRKLDKNLTYLGSQWRLQNEVKTLIHIIT